MSTIPARLEPNNLSPGSTDEPLSFCNEIEERKAERVTGTGEAIQVDSFKRRLQRLRDSVQLSTQAQG